VLVEVGADKEALMTVNGMDTKITAIQLAVCQGKLDAIRLLAQCGDNIDKPPMMMMGTRRCTWRH
jgi:hypothetical protein